MFCHVHTEKWSADTGYFDNDNEKEIEELNEALEKLIAPEVEAIIAKISDHKQLVSVIKQSILQQLTISIDVA